MAARVLVIWISREWLQTSCRRNPHRFAQCTTLIITLTWLFLAVWRFVRPLRRIKHFENANKIFTENDAVEPHTTRKPCRRRCPLLPRRIKKGHLLHSFRVVRCPTAMPCLLMRPNNAEPKQLSMAATARVCECVSYWPYRGVGVVCFCSLQFSTEVARDRGNAFVETGFVTLKNIVRYSGVRCSL